MEKNRIKNRRRKSVLQSVNSSGRELKIEDNESRKERQNPRDKVNGRDEVGMDVDEEDEWNNQKTRTSNNEARNQRVHEIPHKRYLEWCFSKQIGYSIENPQKLDIYTFTERKVAWGYQRVVTTCQGMYYEMKKEQINWKHFKDGRITIGGDRCWRAEGVTVYHPTREIQDRTIVPHRFAINPTGEIPRKILRKDRYYIHVYQTKIGPERRTMRSKGIARELWRRFGKLYWPREMDKNWEGRRTRITEARVNGRETWRRREANRTTGRESNWKKRIEKVELNTRWKRCNGRVKEDRDTGPRKNRQWENRWYQQREGRRGRAKEEQRTNKIEQIREKKIERRELQDISNQLERLTNVMERTMQGGGNM